MRKIHGWLLLLATGLCTLWACQKTVTNNLQQAENEGNKPNTSLGSSANPRLSYGDSLFYLKNLPGNFTILPVSKPNLKGTFKSIPLGLAIDSITGLIDINKSETGLRYKIFYIGSNGKAIDSIKIVISGIDYKDAIYDIASTPNTYDTAFPIYNARPEILLPCGDDDEDNDGDLDDDDNKCVFDETDLDNDGNDDIPGVIQDKLLVDIKKGTIDAEASFNAGVFGSSNPANGISKDFTFYYRLQDPSNRALNKITVRVYHYKKRTDIPQTLLDTLNERNQIATAVNKKAVSGGSNTTLQSIAANPSQGEADLLNSFDLFASKPKRPPIIIIVSQ